MQLAHQRSENRAASSCSSSSSFLSKDLQASRSSSRFLSVVAWVFKLLYFRKKMKNNKVISKKNQSTEPVTYIGRQVRSNAELPKMLNIKREKGIDEAYIPEVQGSKRNQNMPSRNVGGTKFQLVGDQGTNTMAKGTKATMAEEPNKSSLNVAKKSVEGTKASFTLASHSLEKKYKLSTSIESRTKVSNEANRHVMKKSVVAAVNGSQPEHQSIKSKIPTVEEPNKKPTKRNLPSFSLASHSLEKKSKLSTSNESRTKRAKKEDGSDVTQSEMFVETRTSRKGKKVDQDTQNVITKLHDSIQESNECAGETFQTIFGKEKAGRMRCLGRMVTPTVFKRNEEIAEIKRHYSNETTRMAKKLDGLQGLVRCLLKQANPDFDDEALDSIMENAMENAMDDDNGASTSTQMHDLDKETHPTFEEGELEVEDDE
ncbi:hypothetical protein P8452_56255 [Trifolium repens]|nr:hypothetical protein P8452_56255 [Trifolium repens]